MKIIIKTLFYKTMIFKQRYNINILCTYYKNDFAKFDFTINCLELFYSRDTGITETKNKQTNKKIYIYKM